MNETEWSRLMVKKGTHERIKQESEATGIKLWALTERIVDSYFGDKA